MTPQSNDPAEARKRRKEIIQSQRTENELAAANANHATNGTLTVLSTNGSNSASSLTNTNGANGTKGKIAIIGGAVVAPTGVQAGTAIAAVNANGKTFKGPEKKPPKKRKVPTGENGTQRKNSKKNREEDHDSGKSKKTQIRYDPDVPMSKDQLAAWRREARRVRNRESAAASRQRIRNRITELEDEVGEWKSKYTQAIQRLEALEQCIAKKTASGVGQHQVEEGPESANGEEERQEPPPQEPPNQPEAVVPSVKKETANSSG